MSSRRLFFSGLGCECGVSVKKLAEECTRTHGSVVYMFLDAATGQANYIGVTTDLPVRLSEHMRRRLGD